MLFPDCTVLSGTAMSAPSFVVAALGEPAPSHIRVQRRTLYIARPGIVNLETALNARALREDLRIVLRLTDDDLAERLQKTIGNTISRSVPYLAAPAFAAAMLEHQVLRTIAVGRHVLLIADVRVADQAGLAGSFIRDTEHAGQARVLALQVSGSSGLDWSPHRGYLLAPR